MFIQPETILGPVFPEVENYAVELAAARESYEEYDDDAAATVALDAATGVEAAARKLFLFCAALAAIVSPIVYYTIPKKMMWLKYLILGVLSIAVVVTAYVWYVTYSDMQAWAQASADATAAADNAAALDAEELTDEELLAA